ncbi:MAG TPA: phosphonate metabolism protein/1,5-bisphosphokinase (PRPP-forming) PhnN [Mucilaginibacter sp.]|jgi:ribose 1,5-bisphosphokinase|nr:phosphonate metabolism protein/1,5-bisphosphokinase (PRPP-forming) PhnN [Mucilaginibacter sp.]
MSKLFYVIGASGAGKDTLMNYARLKINGSEPVIFAHRYITREPGNSNENHVYLSPEEFKLRAEAGFFALHWESHGKHYGIGAEIDLWLKNGFNVVVNGSRQYLPQAQRLYPKITIVLIQASPEVISRRLAGRGRESADEIEKRIKRSDEINCDLTNCMQIQNDDSVESAGDELLNTITLTKLQNIISK